MKVLICTPLYPPDIGGPATYSKLLAEELPDRGIEVSVLSFGEVRGLIKPLRHFIYFLKVLKRGMDANIIFAQDPVSVGFPSLIASKVLGKKFVLKIVGDYAWEQFQIQGLKSKDRIFKGSTFVSLEEFQNKRFGFMTELRRKIERWVARSAVMVIVPSRYLKKVILMWGVEEDRLAVVYNAFNAPDRSISKEEARKKCDVKGFVIISAGRLVPWKGFKQLIEVIAELVYKIPDLLLLIAGDGPERKNLEQVVEELNLRNRVIFLGILQRKQLFEYIKASDIFVLNSRYEGFSHQLLEVMGLGVPIVTTDAGGNSEIIENQKNGILIDRGDNEKLKDSIVDLWFNQALGEKLKEGAYRKIKRFSKEAMIKETAALLKEAAS
jgi:glycosyltransferase involved in cell wall biosynthesis